MLLRETPLRLPYVAQPTLSLGPLKLHAFGVLVAVAVVVGARLARSRAQRTGLDPRHLEGMLTWVVAAGFVGGHVLDLLFYEPRVFLHDPLKVLKLWDGIGSFGGFVGAILGAFAYVRRHRLASAFRYVDAIAYGFPFGWVFGRLGCAIAYDHPGVPSTFFLAETYRDGIQRHNLGLEEALLTIVLAGFFFFAERRRPRPTGWFVAWLALLYAPVRFLLDGLRIGDTRYFGLTPAQYGSIALFVVGAALASWASRQGPQNNDDAQLPKALAG